MKKKMAVSFMIMALVCALVGGATFAYFTDSSTNVGNSFAAGTVNINAGESTQTNTTVLTNIAPGYSSTGTFAIANTSTLPIKVKVTALQSTGGIWATGGLVLSGVPTDWITIAPAATSTPITYTLNMSTTAGNAFQGASGTLAFKVDAVQADISDADLAAMSSFPVAP